MAKPARRKSTGKPNRFITHGVLFVFCLSLMLVGKADIALMHSVRSVMTGLTLPIADVVSVPFRAVQAMIENMVAVATLREENLGLRQDVEDLRHWQRRAEILQGENRQLRSVSGVIAPDDTVPVSARVVAVNADSFAHSVMVNLGSRAGIKKGDAAVTTDGLAGIVVATGLTHAQILLITDINAMVPVILASSSWPAITTGRNGSRLFLRFLPAGATVAVGDLVQTSGHGGVLPPSIAVGRVEAINGTDITITPTADLERLSFVTILTQERDTGFTVDAIDNPSFRPLPPDDDSTNQGGFSLEGLNAVGGRTGSDISGAGNTIDGGGADDDR